MSNYKGNNFINDGLMIMV